MSNEKKQDLAAYKRLINPERDNEYLIAPYIFSGFGLGFLICFINTFFSL